MRRIFPAAIVAVLAGGAIPEPSRADALMQRIVKYECEQANRDGLPFKCRIEVSKGIPLMLFTYSQPGRVSKAAQYREDLLVRRFIDSGGDFVRQIDSVARRQRICRQANRSFLICKDWKPQN
tara:strand:- start:646 stop:1014 length:369 start_codon:yes stop_codon:yes gene_type:complete